jgi:hypothetical protein
MRTGHCGRGGSWTDKSPLLITTWCTRCQPLFSPSSNVGTLAAEDPAVRRRKLSHGIENTIFSVGPHFSNIHSKPPNTCVTHQEKECTAPVILKWILQLTLARSLVEQRNPFFLIGRDYFRSKYSSYSTSPLKLANVIFTPYPIIYPSIFLMQLRTQFILHTYRKLMYLYIKTVVFMCIKKFEVIPRFYFNI